MLGSYTNSKGSADQFMIREGSDMGDSYNSFVVKKAQRSYNNYDETIVVEHRNVGSHNLDAGIQFVIHITRTNPISKKVRSEIICIDVPCIFADMFLKQLGTISSNKEVPNEKC